MLDILVLVSVAFNLYFSILASSSSFFLPFTLDSFNDLILDAYKLYLSSKSFVAVPYMIKISPILSIFYY